MDKGHVLRKTWMWSGVSRVWGRRAGTRGHGDLARLWLCDLGAERALPPAPHSPPRALTGWHAHARPCPPNLPPPTLHLVQNLISHKYQRKRARNWNTNRWPSSSTRISNSFTEASTMLTEQWQTLGSLVNQVDIKGGVRLLLISQSLLNVMLLFFGAQ